MWFWRLNRWAPLPVSLPEKRPNSVCRWPSREFIRGMGYALFLAGDRLARVASWMLFHCGSIKRFSIFNGPSLIKTFFRVRQPYHPPRARARALTCALHINEGRSCLSVFWMLSAFPQPRCRRRRCANEACLVRKLNFRCSRYSVYEDSVELAFERN